MEENKTKTKATKKKVKKKKQGLTSTILLVAIFFVGLSVLLYPTLSDFWNEKRQSQAIMNYDKLIEDLAPEDFSAYFKKAEEYNKKLTQIDTEVRATVTEKAKSLNYNLVLPKNIVFYGGEDITDVIAKEIK